MNTFRRITRITGSIVLWVLVGVGAISGVTWALSMAGLAQTLIVTSGSMSPEIEVGDLLVATRAQPHDVEIGQVMTVASERTGGLVTHRVVDVLDIGDEFVFQMKGDANDAVDAEEYIVARGDNVLLPRITIPGAGRVVTTLGNPIVSIPLLLSLLCLCALAMLPPRSDEESTSDTPSPDDSEADPTPSHAGETRRSRVEVR